MRRMGLFLLCLGLLGSGLGQGQEKAKGPDRWEKSIAAFEKEDETKSPPSQGIVFVGSSSIRLWKLADSFPGEPVLNRGFGGSQIADSVHFASRIVTKYKPRVVVFYAGDNDIASGKKPEQVAQDFEAFATRVHKELPETRILFLAIKPSPSRWKMIEQQNKANEMIAGYCKDKKNLVYVDVVKPMLGSDGQPRGELFLADKLHMSAEGYKIWTDLVKPLLK